MVIVELDTSGYEEPPLTYLFHDESGLPKNGDVFISGFLMIAKPAIGIIRRKIQDVLAGFHFNNELHFTKMSNLRFKVYQAVIETLMPLDWRFHSIVVQNNLLDLSRFGGSPYRCYNFFTRLLIQHRVAECGDILIFTDEKSRLREDNFLDYLRAELNFQSWMGGFGYQVKRVIPVSSKRSLFIQLADLLLGVVNTWETRGLHGEDRKSRIAKSVYYSPYRSKINVWRWRPKKS